MTSFSAEQRQEWRSAQLPPRTHWDSLPTTLYRGELASLLGLIPYFERRPFVAATSSGAATAPNGRLDMVLRSATDDPQEDEVPVAVVSKRYQLLQHRTVIMLAARALQSVDQGLDVGALDAELELTEYAERMAVHIFLPTAFDFTPDDGRALGLRLSCFNTVDGNAKFLAAVGWLRFACANGMVLGEVKSRLHQSHTLTLDPARIEKVLVAGLEQAKQDQVRIADQMGQRLCEARIKAWVDADVAATWGPVAARRTLHIAVTGRDARVLPTRPHQPALPPSQREVSPLGPVPGAIVPAMDTYAMSQVLTWLASGRRDVGERQAWMVQVPKLLAALSG